MTTQTNWTGEQELIFNWFKTGKQHGRASALPGCTKTTACVEGIKQARVPQTTYTVFNKKNQLEANEKLIGIDCSVVTLHSLGFKFCATHWRGVRGDFGAEWNRVKSIYSDAPPQIILMVSQLVGKIKNHFINPTQGQVRELAVRWGIDGGQSKAIYSEEKLAEMAMEVIKLSCECPKDKKISFDDMIWLPARMGWSKPITNLLVVDEAQDVNEPQFQMLVNSVFPSGRMFIVGDKNQAIYGFRGAMADSMDKFKTTLNTAEFKLTTNFRCGKNIIKFAQSRMPELQAGPNAIDGVVETISEEKALNQIKVKDAILSRTNAPLMPICLNLLRKGIPAYVEGKDVGKTLVGIVNSLEAGNVTELFDKLQVWQDNKRARATGWYAAQAIDTANDQAQTIRTLAETCLTVPDVTKKIESLFLDEDKVRVPSVVCSTVHKAKGREWDNVNILNESFQSRRQLNEIEQEQEGNIYKVAITRAKARMSFVSTN